MRNNILKGSVIFIFSLQLFAGATGDALKETAVSTATGAAIGYGASKAVEAGINSSGAFEEVSKSLGKFFSNPLGIGVVSGIGLANSYTLRSAAIDQSIESSNNIIKIEKLMAEFKDNYKCQNGRDDLNEPKCYCYNADGSKNSNRTNSQTCKSLWSTADYMNTLTTDNFNSTNGITADVKGCVNLNNQFDENCNCKKILSASGSNTCQKVATYSGSNLGVGTAGSLASSNALSKTINALASGNGTMGTLDSAKLAIASKNTADFGSKVINAGVSKNKELLNLNNDGILKNAQNQIFTKKAIDAYNNSAGKYASLNVPMDNPQSMQKSIEQLKKAGVDLTGGKGLNHKATNENKENLNLNDGQNSARNSNVDYGEEKKYNYKKNDVNTDSKASIFDILSHRYIESGIRRLFDEDQKK